MYKIYGTLNGFGITCEDYEKVDLINLLYDRGISVLSEGIDFLLVPSQDKHGTRLSIDLLQKLINH